MAPATRVFDFGSDPSGPSDVQQGRFHWIGNEVGGGGCEIPSPLPVPTARDPDRLLVYAESGKVEKRLSGAGVAQFTMADLLWHSIGSITEHYSVAMLDELARATERVAQPSMGWNKSLVTLRREAVERRLREKSRAKVAQLRRA